MSEEARERWQRQHRRRRQRAPKVAAARKAGAAVTALATVAFAALGLLVAWGWGIAAFACFYLFLRLLGIRPFEDGGDDSGIGAG